MCLSVISSSTSIPRINGQITLLIYFLVSLYWARWSEQGGLDKHPQTFLDGFMDVQKPQGTLILLSPRVISAIYFFKDLIEQQEFSAEMWYLFIENAIMGYLLQKFPMFSTFWDIPGWRPSRVVGLCARHQDLIPLLMHFLTLLLETLLLHFQPMWSLQVQK